MMAMISFTGTLCKQVGRVMGKGQWASRRESRRYSGLEQRCFVVLKKSRVFRNTCQGNYIIAEVNAVRRSFVFSSFRHFLADCVLLYGDSRMMNG